MRMLLNRDDEMVYKRTDTAGLDSAAELRGMATLPRRPTGLRDEEVKAGFSRRGLTSKAGEVEESALRRSTTVSIRAAVRRVGSWRWMEGRRAAGSKGV